MGSGTGLICWPQGGAFTAHGWAKSPQSTKPVSGVDEQGTIGVSKGDTRKWSEAAEATRRKSLLGEESESPKPQELGVRALESHRQLLPGAEEETRSRREKLGPGSGWSLTSVVV